MTNNKPRTAHDKQKSRADGTPGTDAAREQDLEEQRDQKQQEEKLRQSDQIDKGPSACHPDDRR